MRIHFIKHAGFESPGAYLQWAEQKGYTISDTNVYEYQKFPDSVAAIDMLIVMGGPQSPDTTLEECDYYDAPAEMAFIMKCIQAGKAVVGVCLGAQLIGNALGAKYEHSPQKEIGVFPIQLTPDGLLDEKVNHFGTSLAVGHWHNDMPGLTPDCKVLAVSEGCPRQIVRYSPLVYGLQCHLEFTSEAIEPLISFDKKLLKRHSEYRFIQSSTEIRAFSYREMNEKLFRFLDNLVEAYTGDKSS